MPLPTGDPGDIEISFGDIIGNRGQAESNVEIKAESEFFALGASVGDVDGNGTPNLTADRDALDASPYSISEFYGAQYPNVYFDNPIAKVSTTSVMGNGFVDGETARIYFDVNLDQVGTTDYTAGLKYASNNNVVVEDTGGSADPLRDLSVADDTHYADMTIPNLGGANDLYYPFVTTGTYSNAVGANINHYDQLAGGSTNLTTDGSTGYTSTTVDSAGEAITAVVVGGSVSTGTQQSITNGSISSITAGDGGTMAGTYGSGEASQTATIANTPGVIRFALTHNGSPTSARNNTTSTQDFTVSYNLAIDGVASDDHTVNSGTAFTITAISEGLTSTTTMRMGYSTSNSNTSYDGSADKSISTSQFVRSTQTNAFTVNLTSGTSLATYYPKAHYTSGTATTTAGSAIYIAPAYSYSTTGNQTINVNATQAMAASSVVGNNSSVAIASSPSSQTGNNSVTFTPGTNNGIYTISYTGTANYSQTSNTTDLLTVRPIVALSRSTAEVFGFGSYAAGKTPTGVSTTNVTISTSVTGTAGTYNWTKPSGTTVSGGGSGDPTVTMNFSGTAGTKTFSLTVTGRAVGASDTTSTSDSIDVAYTIYTQQSISSVTPNSGDYRRGATTINVAWTSINVALVDIHLVADGSGTSTTAQTTDNDSLDTANASESQTYSAAIVDVGMTNVGTYHVRVRDASDDVPTSTAVSTISILDTAPTTPGVFQDSAGGYNGLLAMDWAASSYRYQYQIYKSSGDSDSSYSQLGSNQTGVSKTITQTSVTTTYGPFYYKVRALNYAGGGTSTEYSSYNTARRFIIYPTLNANNNIPQPDVSTIYSTNLNSTTTSTVMNVTSDSDNVTGYSWATSLTTGASISSTTAQNPTITAGSGVGTITATLTVSGNESQAYAHSGDNITVNYYPKIYNVTTNQEAGTTILINTTDLILKNIFWQGFTSAGFTVSVWSLTGGNGYERSEGPFTINDLGGTYAYNANVNNTGGAQIKESEWAHNTLCNMGVISQAGTVYMRVVDAGGSIAYDEAITIADYEDVQLTGYTALGANSGFDDAEDAVRVTIPGGASTYNVTVYYVGTPAPGAGTVVILDTKSPTDYFAGNNKWWDFSGAGITGYVGKIDNSGNLTAANYYSDGNAQPKAPTGIGLAAQSNATQINITWTDVSAIEDGYLIYQSTSGTATNSDPEIADLSSGTTSFNKTGLSAGTTYYYAIYADNGTGRSTVLQGSQQTQLVDATTIGSISSVNATTAVTVAGNQSGLSGGVTFGLVDTGATTTFLSGKSTSDTTDSRYTLDAYTANFTAADSNSTLTLQGRVIDPNDGGGTNKNTSTFTVYPLLTTSKNTIHDQGVSTIYSSTNISTTAFANDGASYANSISYGTPQTATDNVTGYLYSADSTPSGHSFGSATSATTTFGGGSGVDASVIVSLRIQGSGASGTQTTTTTDTLAVLYKPCIIAESHTAGTLVVNSTNVVVSALSWQGFADATGLQLSIRNSGGTIVSSNTTVNYANTEGGTTTSVSKTGLSINLGDSSSAGTMYIRVAKINDTSAYRQFSITVSDYTSIAVYGVGAGYSTPEHALVAKLAGWSSATKYLAPGVSWEATAVTYNDNDATVYQGGNYYHGYKPSSTTNYHTINPYGVIGNIYAGDDTVPPRDATGASTSAAQTSISISSFSVSNYVFNTSGTTTATFSSWATTKTVTVTWNDNSALEDGYRIYENNSSGTLKGTAAENAETDDITGITAGITFAVYAFRTISEETTVLSLNANTTSYSHSNDGTLYLHATNNSGGATTNLDDITSGTTFTWDKDDLAVGTYTFRVKYGSYTGTTIATDSSVTVSAATSWSSVSAGDVGDVKGAFDTNGRFSITVTDGVGDTTLHMPVAAVSSEQLGVISSLSSGVSAPANAAAITTAGALGGWSGGGGYEVTHTHSGLHTTTYYFWFGFTPNHGSDGVIETLTITWSNNGITRDQDVVLRQVASGGGKDP